MRKYFAVAKTLLKAQLVYRFSIFSGILQIAVRLLFAWLLWSAVFGGPDSTALVGGFTFGGMFSYYVVSSFLLQLEMSEGVSGEISARIRDGSFSKFMVIPTGVQLHFGAQTAGAALYYLLFNLAATVALSLLFGVRIELSAEPWTLAAAALMCLMGLVFMVQLHFFLGILTFRFENIGIFLMIQNNLVYFVTGGILPLALLPEAVVQGMRFLPFYYVTYLPSMLAVGRNAEEAGIGLAVLAGWMLAFALLNGPLYRRLRTRYDAVGI